MKIGLILILLLFIVMLTGTVTAGLGYNNENIPVIISDSGSGSGGNVTSVTGDECILVNPTTGEVTITFNSSCAGSGGTFDNTNVAYLNNTQTFTADNTFEESIIFDDNDGIMRSDGTYVRLTPKDYLGGFFNPYFEFRSKTQQNFGAPGNVTIATLFCGLGTGTTSLCGMVGQIYSFGQGGALGSIALVRDNWASGNADIFNLGETSTGSGVIELTWNSGNISINPSDSIILQKNVITNNGANYSGGNLHKINQFYGLRYVSTSSPFGTCASLHGNQYIGAGYEGATGGNFRPIYVNKTGFIDFAHLEYRITHFNASGNITYAEINTTLEVNGVDYTIDTTSITGTGNIKNNKALNIPYANNYTIIPKIIPRIENATGPAIMAVNNLCYSDVYLNIEGIQNG